MENETFIKTYDNAIPHVLCDMLIEKFDANTDQWENRDKRTEDRGNLKFNEVHLFKYMDTWKEEVEALADLFKIYVDNQIVSDFFGLFSNTLFNKLNILSYIRVKLNLQIRDSMIRKSQLHRDVEVISQEQKTGIFYLNTNDGYTFFENGEKIKSVENRMVIFPSSLYHAGTTHTDAQYRCVVNMNWI